jgi:hypothetical protein
MYITIFSKSSILDIVSPVPSGIPFKIVWKNSTQILPVMMKIELLSSAGLNNILAKLDISGDPTYEPSNE